MAVGWPIIYCHRLIRFSVWLMGWSGIFNLDGAPDFYFDCIENVALSTLRSHFPSSFGLCLTVLSNNNLRQKRVWVIITSFELWTCNFHFAVVCKISVGLSLLKKKKKKDSQCLSDYLACWLQCLILFYSYFFKQLFFSVWKIL